MEFQTWTRKANAIAAVEKALGELPSEFMDNIFITGVEAQDVGLGETKAFTVRVFIDNGPDEA